jgi:uncharacterized protein (DUF342 family)
MSQKAAEPQNGHIKIHLTEDLMKAEVDMFPPGQDGAGFTILSLISDLEVAGVTWGVNKETLENNILKCLTDSIVIKGVLAAEGQKAVKAVPSYWHLKKRLLGLPEADLKAPNVDHKNKSPYIMVKKGEALAKMVPEAPGEAGRNIAGEILTAGAKDVVSFRPGDNLNEKEAVLYAACHGRFEIREKVMSVNETLEIAGNVDYSTGHVAFPGDVIIHGAVCDGFRVAAGKSIFVKQTMDASQILSRGDLVVEGGIKGRGEGLVRVDGNVNAKFIENATVESHRSIYVEKAVMHSNLSCLGVVDLGETGVLVGGEIKAEGGIRVGHIGRPDSPSAIIRAGSDYIAEGKLLSARAQVDRLEAKLDKLKSRQSLSTEQQKLIGQVEEVLEKMNQSEKDLLKRQHPNRDALITVFGKVDEGTDIHIAELSLRLSSPMEAVTFYYKEVGPELAVRDITAADKAGTEANDSTLADPRPSETEDSPEPAEPEEEKASSDSQVDQ